MIGDRLTSLFDWVLNQERDVRVVLGLVGLVLGTAGMAFWYFSGAGFFKMFFS